MRRLQNPLSASAAVLLACLLVACSDPVGPGPTSDMQIRVHVTGGFAGVDYTILVDGASRAVVGESCVNGCDFSSGEILMGVAESRIRDWAERLLAGGIIEENGRDYGTECCDRFHSVLDYADRIGGASVQGTTDLMPAAFQEVISELSQLGRQQLPVVVDFGVDPATLPGDPLALLELRHSGSVLEFDVEYGGGCEAHELELVAVGGWMESFPVQVRLVLTHDDRDDPCDALVRNTARFGLRPLEDAYGAAYPGEPVGERTLRIHLDWPGGSGPSVTHRF